MPVRVSLRAGESTLLYPKAPEQRMALAIKPMSVGIERKHLRCVRYMRRQVRGQGAAIPACCGGIEPRANLRRRERIGLSRRTMRTTRYDSECDCAGNEKFHDDSHCVKVVVSGWYECIS